MNSRIIVRFDSVLDVLAATRAGAAVVRARPSKSDGRLILRLDSGGAVVGLEILGPTEIRPQFWREHPDRHILPPELLSEVDAWMEELWSHLAVRKG